jgi:gamma-glutamyltranspeptidase/glutathione hydrolase/leukotriene-C4 hydrolase
MSRRSDYDNLDTEPLLSPEQRRIRRQRLWATGIAATIILLVIGIVVSVQFSPLISSSSSSNNEEIGRAKKPPRLTASFARAAVVVDGAPCAAIGRSILEDGGTAVDAAVAALFCNGAYNPQSMGLGGGFLMTVYAGGRVYALNAREAAPALATPNMYGNDSRLALNGPLSVAVPGEVAGYWAARQRFGNRSIAWRRIIQPTIDLCRGGIPVSWTLAAALRDYEFAAANATASPAEAALKGQRREMII